jgi:hypothetical protein
MSWATTMQCAPVLNEQSAVASRLVQPALQHRQEACGTGDALARCGRLARCLEPIKRLSQLRHHDDSLALATDCRQQPLIRAANGLQRRVCAEPCAWSRFGGVLPHHAAKLQREISNR